MSINIVNVTSGVKALRKKNRSIVEVFTSYTEGFFKALSTVALRYSFMLTNNNYAQNILLQPLNGHNFYLKFHIRQFFPKQKNIHIFREGLGGLRRSALLTHCKEGC